MQQDIDGFKYQAGALTTTKPVALPSLTVGGQTVTGGTPAATPQPDVILPADHGAIAWTAPPSLCTTTSALTSGTLYLAKLPIRAAATVSKVWWANTAAASGATAGQCFAGLYGSDGTLLSSTSIDSKTTINVQSATLDASQPVAANSSVWAALLWNATTPPTVMRGGGQSAPANNFNLSAAAYQFATAGTGLTALPGSITPASNSTTGALALWIALS